MSILTRWQAQKALQEEWRQRLGRRGRPRLKIDGLLLYDQVQYIRTKNRSMTEAFEAVAKLHGVSPASARRIYYQMHKIMGPMEASILQWGQAHAKNCRELLAVLPDADHLPNVEEWAARLAAAPPSEYHALLLKMRAILRKNPKKQL